MNRDTIVLSVILLAFANVFCGVTQAAEPGDGFVKIFDRRTLADWDGDSAAWAVRDGAITCLGRQGGKNWLIWRGGELEDFELRLKFKYLAGNSGVQVRSEEIEKWQVRGYQVEIAQQSKMGLWHHSLKPAKYRHYLATAGQKVNIDLDGEANIQQLADPEVIQKSYRENDWNELTITGRGPRLVQTINGVVYSELNDHDRTHSASRGLLAFQDHGKGTQVQFKEIYLKSF